MVVKKGMIIANSWNILYININVDIHQPTRSLHILMFKNQDTNQKYILINIEYQTTQETNNKHGHIYHIIFY